MANYEQLLENAENLNQTAHVGHALQALKQAHQLRPSEPEPLAQMALIFAEAGDTDAAIELFTKAAKCSSSANAFILVNLGLLHYQAKRFDDAEANLQEAAGVIENGTEEVRKHLATGAGAQNTLLLEQCRELEETAFEIHELLSEIQNRAPEPSEVS